MYDTLRELTQEEFFVNLAPHPRARGVEYVLSVRIDELDLDRLKRLIEIAERGGYDAGVSGSWLELRHARDPDAR